MAAAGGAPPCVQPRARAGAHTKSTRARRRQPAGPSGPAKKPRFSCGRALRSAPGDPPGDPELARRRVGGGAAVAQRAAAVVTVPALGDSTTNTTRRLSSAPGALPAAPRRTWRASP